MRRHEWRFPVLDLTKTIDVLLAVNPRLTAIASGNAWSLLDDADGPVWIAVMTPTGQVRRILGRHLRPGDVALIDRYLELLRFPAQ